MPKKLDDWFELVAASVLVILLSPVIVPMLVLTGIMNLYAWIIKSPTPQITEVLGDVSELSSKEIIQNYLKKTKKIISDAVVVESESEYTKDFIITSTLPNSRKVTFSYDDYIAYITIEDVDTAFWHTAEHDDIDMYFWLAIGALRGAVETKRNILGIKHVFVFSKEMGVWAKTGANSVMGFHSLTYVQKP